MIKRRAPAFRIRFERREPSPRRRRGFTPPRDREETRAQLGTERYLSHDRRPRLSRTQTPPRLQPYYRDNHRAYDSSDESDDPRQPSGQGLRTRQIEPQAKDLKRFDPDSPDSSINDYLREVDHCLLDLPHASSHEKLKRIWKTTARSVRDFMGTLPPKVRSLQKGNKSVNQHLQTAKQKVLDMLELIQGAQVNCGYGCQKYLVRLLTYLPGATISKAPVTPQLLYETGKTAARMDKILKEHPHLGLLQRETFIWSLSLVPLLEKYTHVLDGDPLQEVVKSVIHQFKTSVVPKRSTFRKCINHGDFNDLNILVQPDETDGYRISGILDFGDMNSGYYIHELAIVIMYMMIEHPNPIEVGGHVLAGWESVLPLNEAEKDCLFVLVLCRFCQSLVLARYSVTLYPENAEYLMITSIKGVKILHQMWELGKEQVEKVWFQSAAQIGDRK
uniref:Hydroxylysine kinase n=1 Tax=Labrus bergylta TaxID=56723 RepID=A0A3Q3FI03_9LABR